MFLYIGLVAAVIVAYIIVLWIVLKVSRNNRFKKNRSRSVPSGEIEGYVKKMAAEHSVSRKKTIASWPVPRMEENYNYINSTYTRLNDDIIKNLEVPPAAEWILDNFYLIEEQVKQLRSEIVKKSYLNLPTLKTGKFKGQSRIFALVMELSLLTNGKMDDSNLAGHIKTYEEHNKIFERELLALPIVIKLALLENIRSICEKIRDTQVQWKRANDIVEIMLSNNKMDDENAKKLFVSGVKAEQMHISFIEHLFYRMKILSLEESAVSRNIHEYLRNQEKITNAISKHELNSQSATIVSAENCILGLKYFSTYDWSDLLESMSSINHILSGDPDGIYSLMDFSTRSYYRNKIEEFSLDYDIEEGTIALKAIELAAESFKNRNVQPHDNELQVKWHVGYYLVGKGITKLQKALNLKKKWAPNIIKLSRNYPEILYIGSIVLITVMLISIAAVYTINNSLSNQWLWMLIAIIAVSVPSSEIAVRIVNWVSDRSLSPAIFPAMELKEGIPDNLSTIVVIPTLLPNKTRVNEIIENMETHYLSNRETNLYFALIGAFKDSNKEEPADLGIIDAAMSGIKILNKKYAKEGADIFYYFHRKSKFSPANNKWIGWERKRGALIEFNDFLLGSKKTSFYYCSNHIKDLSNIKYVITLDSDTVLPIGMAKMMVGTMAHPLNKPIIAPERGIVVEGYGLLQPRVDSDSESSGRSLFSKIFTGQIGIDPYSNAISDLYQDMFGEGIYTGKGIYDLNVFQKVLKNVVPENTVLSHDLYEGSYVRTALVTNLKLVESYPTKYSSVSARLYRWSRGDWQLMPFLFGKIPGRDGKIKNPISLLSKWKIFDNLRRTAIPPALMVLFALGLSILPGSSLIWLSYVAVTLLSPLITSTMNYLMSGGLFIERIKNYMPVIIGLKALLYQVILTFIFLPYQAYIMTKAALLTLWRIYISKKNTLEWITSADLEANQKDSLSGYYSKMHSSIWGAIVVGILILVFKPSLAIVSAAFLVVWAMAPCIAYVISRDRTDMTERILKEDINDLGKIARKTWRYFEEFISPSNNYLIPDNYQQEPYRGLAERTSPTNIGLSLLSVIVARDMGFIGYLEMTDIISKIISTLESLKKWNGHLYNWYNTKTLKKLSPGYISTVDNGNLVCYLTTLVQGLDDYLGCPIVDIKFISGILDTMGCAEQGDFDAGQITQFMDDMQSAKKIDFAVWTEILNKFLSEDTLNGFKDLVWRPKVERMVKRFKSELSELVPWVDVLALQPRAMPEQLSGEYLARIDKVTVYLRSNPSIRELPAICTDALESIDILIADYECSNEEITSWLRDIKKAFEQSRNTAETLIGANINLVERINALSKAMLFKPLYNPKKQLFSIGYSTREKKLTRSHYDLLASEARQTSFIAIARGEVPASHWFRMGRTLTVMDGYKGLVSWTGTMFEYLMPLLVMKSYKNTLLDETCSFAVRNQKKYGMQMGIPWGTSESGYHSLEKNKDYKYKAFGVPWLGLKRGLVGNAVIAPYATFLALMVDPESALQNISHLKSDGLEGDYGFYEAADYTPKSLLNRKNAIVMSFMAHHEGMSLLAIDNYLNRNIMQERFHSNPAVRSARLLLQEKNPGNVVFTKEIKEKVITIKGPELIEKSYIRKYNKPNEIIPKTHILSNGDYSVALTDRGTGYSKNCEIQITRWREDITLDHYGTFCFLKNVETGHVWSSAYAPLNVIPDDYEVIFTPDKVQYKRIDEDIETITEIVVASGDNVEIRRISVKNLGETPKSLEITSYFEAVMANQAQDVEHPAFSNLFVETEYLPQKRSIIASRRIRANDEKTWQTANTLVIENSNHSEIQFETDRMKFIGRGKTIASARAINRPLSDTAGPVLDPVMSLRTKVDIDPGKTKTVSFVTSVSDNDKTLLGYIERYSTSESVEDAFHLAKVRSQLDSKQLNIPDSYVKLYENMIPHIIFISPLKRQHQNISNKNTKGQSVLWTYDISGDFPIVLLVINDTENMELVKEVIEAHEYWWTKNLKVDLVVLANMKDSYNQPFHDNILDIESMQTPNKGKAFVLNMNEVPDEDVNLLYAAARIVLVDSNGTLKEQMHIKKEHLALKHKRCTGEITEYFHGAQPDEKPPLSRNNGLGGFRPDGKEYVIELNAGQYTPAPWVNVIANARFGFNVSEAGSSYTWCENSRENKLTPWTNDPVCDSPGEILYISDNDNGEVWTPTALPIREPETYKIKHGFGYSVFEHLSHDIMQSMVQFVPVNDSVKVSILSLENRSEHKRELSLTYYVRPVLGVSDQITAMHIKTRQAESGALLIENPYNEEFSGRIAFMDSSVAERSVTGDRAEFFGAGGATSPNVSKLEKLSGALGTGLDPCAAIKVNITLLPGKSTDVVFMFGVCRSDLEVAAVSKKYINVSNAYESLDEVKKFWDEKLSVIQVKTPSEPFDFMLNGWLQYQTISCRFWAKTSFYQSGGAIGFRDQLQDCLSIVNIWPEVVRSQILLHARHQFKEGDVQHWWHEPWGRGTRTRCSDDLLWLPYVTAEYVKITGDIEILKEQISFLDAEVLKDSEKEKYIRPSVSTETATLYEHCILAIEKASQFGAHGLPLIGSGDWNDGMNNIGIKGFGESVWLGWFMISVLKNFAPACDTIDDVSNSQKYKELAGRLSVAIDKCAWDGKWYQRAYFDDGKILGTIQNSECKIDSIAQSWSVLSGAGDIERTDIAMDSLGEHLVDEKNGIIKLLSPPFDHGNLEPGYIKGYLPGVRENGGQYTHAAAWAIMAWARLGEGNKAWDCFELINPINHTRNTADCSVYKLEPYVVSADVYSMPPNCGRGGWSWYTGSAGWLYKAGIEEILGFKKHGDTIILNPCISQKWTEYSLQYKYINTMYKIDVHNPQGVNKGALVILVDGDAIDGNIIHLVNDGATHEVNVYLNNNL